MNFGPYDYDRRVVFAAEYRARYGRLMLPGEYMMSAYELAAPGVLEAVFQNHALLVNEFRKTIQ